MTGGRDPGKRDQKESPPDTPDTSTPFPTPPENDRLHDFEPEGDTVRIEYLTDPRGSAA